MNVFKILMLLIVALIWSTIFHELIFPVFKVSSLALSIGPFFAGILSSLGYFVGFIPLFKFLFNKDRQNKFNSKFEESNREDRLIIYKRNNKKDSSFYVIDIKEIYLDFKKNNSKNQNYYIDKPNGNFPYDKIKINISELIKSFKTDGNFFLGIERTKLEEKDNEINYLTNSKIDNDYLENGINKKIEINPRENNNNLSGIDIKEAKKLLSKHYKIPMKDIEIRLKG